MCDAGQKFQAIAQQDIKNTSALHQWARSICIRASLKDNPEVSRWLASELLTACGVMLSQSTYWCGCFGRGQMLQCVMSPCTLAGASMHWTCCGGDQVQCMQCLRLMKKKLPLSGLSPTHLMKFSWRCVFASIVVQLVQHMQN